MSPLEENELLFLDTETTGVPAAGNEALSVSIIDQAGKVLLHSLVRPVNHTSWPAAQEVNGISPADVLRPELPTLADLSPLIAAIVAGRHVVIYNAVYDCEILAEPFALGPPALISCAMEEFATYYGDWHDYHESYTFQPLEKAAKHVLYWSKSKLHNSLNDCYRLRAVWEFLHWPSLREAVAEEKERRQEKREESEEIQRFLDKQQAGEDARAGQLNAQWTRAFWERRGLAQDRALAYQSGDWSLRGAAAPDFSAKQSADVFSRQLTGYPVETWNRYGKLLRLPRYERNGKGRKKLPEHLVGVGNSGVPHYRHFLRPTWEPAFTLPEPTLPPALPVVKPKGKAPKPEKPLQPVAMWVVNQYGDELSLQPLYDLRKLTLGVDYVPYSFEFPIPAGYCSAYALSRQHKLKPKQIKGLRPAFFRPTDHKYIPDFLLYAIPEPAPAAH